LGRKGIEGLRGLDNGCPKQQMLVKTPTMKKQILLFISKCKIVRRVKDNLGFNLMRWTKIEKNSEIVIQNLRIPLSRNYHEQVLSQVVN